MFDDFRSFLLNLVPIWRNLSANTFGASWIKRCAGMSWATWSNLGMVQALNVRCVQRTISRTTLISSAYLVQKGAQHLMAPLRTKTANVKLASSSKKMESGHLIEEKVLLRLDFCHVWCCFGDAQFIVSETGQGAWKKHRNRHHSNVCNNSEQPTAVKNSINQQTPNHFGAEFLQLPVVLTWLLDEELWMPSSSSTSSKQLCTMRGSKLGLCSTRFKRPHGTSTAGLRPVGQQDPGVWMFTPSRTL